jgi:hypothetical protein
VRKCDKIMYRGCTTGLRKLIVKSYRIQRYAVAESEKKGGKK